MPKPPAPPGQTRLKHVNVGGTVPPVVPTGLPTTTLPPIVHVPSPRIIIPPLPITPARPSSNLGHPMNSARGNVVQLFNSVGLSSTLPFNGMKPRTDPVSTSYGSVVSRAVHAVQKPVHNLGGIPGPRPSIPFGQRIKAAIKAVRG